MSDQRALAAAAATGAPVIPLYILDDTSPGRWRMGAASRWWLDKSLARLSGALEGIGSRLVLRRGEAGAVLDALAAETGASTVYCQAACEPWAVALEVRMAERLATRGVMLKRMAGALLHRPGALKTKTGGNFKVYTPFWRALLAGDPPPHPIAAPTRLAAPDVWPTSEALAGWGLHPTRPDWSAGFAEAWSPGEAGALDRLERFIKEALAGYGERRNRPDLAGTSRLSPHLHFGEISPAACWHAASAAVAAADPHRAPGLDNDLDTFRRELVWRDFSCHLLAQFPELPERPLRSEFAAFPWAQDGKGLEAWQRGRTGFPIVDAGMRELWHTGWMHNRVRMIVASFLIKDLLVPWQDGQAWFWDTLVDADLANNAASWQWVAGCGADAAPFFRIFNPIKQGQTFDPDGDYVRRWVPELRGLPAKYIHEPASAPAMVLSAAGVTLGRSYPLPIVDHTVARGRAMAAFEALRG